jgi:signal transduction histidine kinase
MIDAPPPTSSDPSQAVPFPDQPHYAHGAAGLDFGAHARELALHWGRRWMLGICAAAILWWPTDPWVFADSPESQVVFAWIRGVGLAVHLGMYLLLTYVRWVRGSALLVLSVYGSVAIMLPAFGLAHLGGPDEGWFGYLYIALIPGAFVQIPLKQRLIANFMPAVTAALAYFGSHPEYLADKQTPSSLSYLVFSSLLAIGLGAVLYGVVHRSYLQAVALARTSNALEALNRDLEQRALEQEHSLRALAGEASQARESERTRIARELHDEIGQELTAARMALTLARRRYLRDPQVLGESLTDLEGLLARTAQTTRELVSQLRPRALETHGFGPAVALLVEDLAAKTGIPIRTELGELPPLETERQTALYRIIQEGITNALKHARATAIRVVVEARGDAVHCLVEDDGVGLTVQGIARGHGLAGLRERAIALGGTLDFGPNADKRGTRLVATFPGHAT